MAVAQPIRYRDDVEQPYPDEAALIDETIATMRHSMEGAFEQHRHQTSGTHAKSHGVVTGSLTVLPDLPDELAQGLFATPASYGIVVRYASEPGVIDPDTVSRARGFALKILDVPGEKLRAGWTSQDILLNTWPIIPQGDIGTYLDAIKARDEHAGSQLKTVAATMLKHPEPKGLLFDRTPNIHPVAFSFYSQAAFRYGDYIAKFGVFPVGPDQEALAEQKVSRNDPPGILKDWVRDWYATHTGHYELRVQLCTDPATMPVEDASIEWPEEQSPYRTVAVLEIPAQETFSPARRVYAEDVLSWRPWFGLAAHRPLGNLNRLRNRTYEVLGGWRHDMNATVEQNPTSRAEVPD